MADIAIAALSSFRVWENRDWEYEYWYTGCEKLFGYTAQELMADKTLWLSQVFPEDRETIVMPLFEAFFAKRNATAEYRFNRKDGSVRWISSTCVCQKIEDSCWTIAAVHHDISDRKQLEIALQSSEEKLRLALDLNTIGIWEWHIGTGVVFWNASHYTVLGYQPGEIEPSYQRWRDRIHPDDIEFVEQKIIQALETHADYEAEFRLVLDDGNIRWLHSKGRAVYDEAGQPVRMVGVEYDISDRKQAEAESRQTEAEFRAMFNLIGVGMAQVDIKTRRFLRVNPAFCGITGYSEAELLALSVDDINHPDDRDRNREHDINLLHGDSYQSEKRYLRKDGSTVWVLATGNIIRDPAEQPLHALIAIQDISDRKQLEAEKSQAEIALQNSEEQLRLALDLNSIGYWDWHLGTGAITWNANHYRLLGYQPQEEVEPSYQRWRDRVHPDDIALTEQKIAQALETQTDYEAEFRVVLEDGSIRWLLGKGRGIYRELGQPVRMIGVIFDISDRQLAEAALRQSEAKYRTLFNSIDEGYFLADVIFDENDQPVDIFYLEANPAAIAMLGQDFTGRRLREINANYESYWYEIFGCVARTGEGQRLERYSGPDQTWYDFYVFKVGDENSRRIAIIFQNISDRKRREANAAFLAEIADEFSRLSSVEEIIQAVGAKLGAYLNVTTCNFCEVDEVQDWVVYLGRWNVESLPRLPDRICLSEQVSEDFRRRVRAGETIVSENTQTNSVTNAKANAAIGVLSFITVPFHKDGEWKYLFSINDIVPRTWREDEMELVCEVANRTFPRIDRARAEAALRENEEMRRLALAGARAGSWNWDLLTGKLTWSSETYHLHGLNPDKGLPEYEGWYNTLLHPDDREWVNAYILQAIEQRLPEIELEFRILHPQQGIRWLLSRGRLTLNDRGELIRLSGINLDISDRKQTELALQESEQRLSLFVKCAPVSVAMFDRNMNYLAVSQRWVDIYHLGSIEAVIGHSHYEILPNIPERWRQIHQQSLAGFIQRCDEDRYILPDGSLQWLRWEVQPWQMGNGEVGGILIFVEDITERQQAELMRQQQIQREQAIADISQDIRRSLDLNKVLSRTVERVRHLLNTDRVIIFRFRPDWQGEVVVESVGAEWKPIVSTNIFDPCFSDRYIEPYRQGRIATITDIDTEDLKPCYVELLKQFQVKANLVIPLLQGEQLWGLLIAHQCSAPRQWENTEIELLQQLANQVSIAIQQSELYQKIREQAALIDIATDAIFVGDLDHRILFWNQGAERLYGWTAEAALGETTHELFDGESASQLAENLHIAVEQGFWQGELEQVTKSGQKVRVASRWTLVRDESGQPKSILVVNSDITEKKQLEKQFYRAQRLESIGTLASGIAHDLNNILTPILAVSHLLPLKFPNLDKQTRQMLEILEVSANRGTSLVKQVLSFSRGQEGQRVILQVGHLLSEVVSIANRTFPKSIQISTEIPTMELWTISADTTQIHQVLMNLVINARDAMPNGGSLTISAENRYLDQNYAGINVEAKVGFYVIVSISDTGIGIPPELLERIFDPFFTTKEIGKGTGLGLATVQGIVKNHGGFVKVYSEIGNGTQFQVFLPACEGQLSQPIPDEELPIGNGELILIVDDEATIRQIAKTSLENYNYRTIFASDGIEALSIYAKYQQEISVVLIDLMMPNLDGLTAIRAMQKMNPQVKAIATSGLSTNSELALAVNVKTFLLKPYMLKELLNALHDVISTTNSQTD